MKLQTLKSTLFLAGAITTLAALLVYLSTMCRTVYVGDAGEFSLDFATLGIAHPPGYPLFTLCGRVFVMLTAFLKPALSANIFAVIMTAATLPVLYILVKNKNGKDEQGTFAWYAALLTLLWGFSPLFWSETVAVEVYGMNVLLIAILLALTFSQYPWRWFLVAYIGGMALAHHPTALTVIPVIIYEFFRTPDKSHKGLYSHYLALFLLGLSVYLYLAARASVEPIADWGHPTTLALLFNHMTAAQYQHIATFSLENLMEGIRLFGALLFRSGWWVGIGLTLTGLYIGIKQKDSLTIAALIMIVADLLLVCFYRIPDIDSYYLPGLLACFLLSAKALMWVWDIFITKKVPWVSYSVVGFSVFFLLILNYGKIDRSDSHLMYDYGKLILDTAGSGIVFTRDDNASFSSMYLRYAENYRPQVEVFDQAERLVALTERASQLDGRPISDYKDARNVLLQKAPGKKFLVKSHYYWDEDWYQTKVKLFSAGLLYTTSSAPVTPLFPSLTPEKLPDDFKSRQMLINLELCQAEDAMRKLPALRDQAEEAVARAQALLEDEPRASMHNQLGVSLRHMKMYPAAFAAYDRALKAPRMSDTEEKEITFNISNLFKDQGNEALAKQDYYKAAVLFCKALEKDPNNSQLLYNVGAIYLHYLKMPEKAIPYFESYLELVPNDNATRELVETTKKNSSPPQSNP
jgi:tetratricopeptide (TPR) repeat protein